MENRMLGKEGPIVSALGLGCMGMSEFYGKSEDAQSIKVILRALSKGITMLDTSDTYGSGHNEELISRALRQWGDDVFLASKFGIVRQPGNYKRTISGNPQYVKEACDASLRRLNRDCIDLYYIHRVDVNTPIQDTMGALSDLVKAGKIRYVGISEASAATIRKAHDVYPLTAVQTEYSLWTRHIEAEILPVVRELGIGLVAYSPLGRGFLTGALQDPSTLEEGDFRRANPRFQADNLKANRVLVNQLQRVAADIGATPAQVALAWLLQRGSDIVPIPGTRNGDRLEENIGALDVTLDPEDSKRLEEIFSPARVKGDRYPEAGKAGINA